MEEKERKEKTFIRFPSWETIAAESNNEEYLGYSFKERICENLYLCLERRNLSQLWSDHIDMFFVMLCTRSHAPVAVEMFPYSQEGYCDSIAQIMTWAEDFQKAFSNIKNNSKIEKKEVYKNDCNH